VAVALLVDQAYDRSPHLAERGRGGGDVSVGAPSDDRSSEHGAVLCKVVPTVMVVVVVVVVVMAVVVAMAMAVGGGSGRRRDHRGQRCGECADRRQLGYPPDPARRFHASWIGRRERPRSAISD
jgi:hypothetical protein